MHKWIWILDLEQGRNDGDMGIYTPQKKSAQVNFLWGKNDIRTAIQQFYTPQKKLLYPKNKFLLCPWFGVQSSAEIPP